MKMRVHMIDLCYSTDSDEARNSRFIHGTQDELVKKIEQPVAG